MASRDYTAASYWAEAIRDFSSSKANDIGFMRFNLINRSLLDVVAQVYDLVSRSYMTSLPIQASTVGKYSTGTGTWTAATNTLTITMSSNFTISDIGSIIVFRGTTDTYIATILTVPTTTSVTVNGFSLSTVDIATINYALLVPTAITSDTIDISSVRYMRSGQQVQLKLESTATTAIEAVSPVGLRTFNNAGGNSKKIVWTFEGDQLRLSKGSGLSSYATLTLWYPRIPLPVTVDTSPIDAPDGGVISLGILRCSSLVGLRIGSPVDRSKEMAEILSSMYRVAQGDVSTQKVDNIVNALR